MYDPDRVVCRVIPRYRIVKKTIVINEKGDTMRKLLRLSAVTAVALFGITTLPASADMFGMSGDVWGAITGWRGVPSGHDMVVVDGWSDTGDGYGLGASDVWGEVNSHPSATPVATSPDAGDSGDFGYDNLNHSADRLAAAATDIYDDAVERSQTVTFKEPGGEPLPQPGGGFDGGGENTQMTDGTNYTHADGTVDQTARPGESYDSGPSYNGGTPTDTLNGWPS